jgi:hypothetical protein
MAYRWTLSPTPVTVSLTFSVVDLELSGVTWSATSVTSVSMGLRAGVEDERGTYCRGDPCGWRQTC